MNHIGNGAMQEQRRSVRLLEENSLSITTVGGASGAPRKSLQVMSKDISDTGVRIRTPDFLAVNTRLSVEIRFSSPPLSATLKGIVRWVRHLSTLSMYEAGIEFDALEPDVAELLSCYVGSKRME